MTKREPVIRFYTDEECTKPLGMESQFAACEAGTAMIYDVYARNEGRFAFESWDISVQAWYQVLKDDDDETKGYDLKPTTDMALISTPRPHRLEPGVKAHLRFRWSPPADNYYPLIWKIAAGGPYIITPVD